jgi:hypothetical protein
MDDRVEQHLRRDLLWDLHPVAGVALPETDGRTVGRHR